MTYLSYQVQVFFHPPIFLLKSPARDVLYAAVALYLLLGALFVPLYGLLNMLQPGSFRDGTLPDAPLQWQQLVYFSYTTLTSSVYGDILPVSWWARSLANLEIIAGMLFIAVVMSRLVALYSESKGEHS
ncbi:MAG: two pore domain potassium channel family protein [Chloroflexi bacterium]|nr:two pore domain potassium channel family protein [Ardenticatenaceae bacterium]MBL1131485.1 two pore domain potassium channel family protein [Chloroflexota bacterium]NOG37596.1 two pore domain potassium channel family protein [Chloroflexota bacterium]